jgi:hypothetical protein
MDRCQPKRQWRSAGRIDRGALQCAAACGPYDGVGSALHRLPAPGRQSSACPRRCEPLAPRLNRTRRRHVGVFRSYAPGIIGAARPGPWRSILMTALTFGKAPRMPIVGSRTRNDQDSEQRGRSNVRGAEDRRCSVMNRMVESGLFGRIGCLRHRIRENRSASTTRRRRTVRACPLLR